MQNIEVMPDPAQPSAPETDAQPKADLQEFDWYSAVPVPENSKLKVAAAGCGVHAGDVRDTDYYYG